MGMRQGVCNARGFSSEQQQESDKRYEKSGEYDTQDKYKRVGNPISWANPTGGPAAEENTSKAYTFIYPAGVVIIILFALRSRHNKKKEEENEKMIEKPQMKSYSMNNADFQRPQMSSYSMNDADFGHDYSHDYR